MPDNSEELEHPIDKANRVLWARQCEAEGVAVTGVSRGLQEWAGRRQAPRIVRKEEAA